MMPRTFQILLLILTVSLGFASHVYDITPRRGSINGGTRVAIHGLDFSPDQFNFDYGDGNVNNGNIVYFISETAEVECDVVEYWTTTSTIYCDTRAALAGVYSVYVTVDGVKVEDYCSNDEVCEFEYRGASTPKISSVVPRACTPDNVVTVKGYIVSDIVSDSQTLEEDYEDSNTEITLQRVYMGASICDPIDPETGTVYGFDVASNGDGSFDCRPNSTVVDSKNITFVITSEYGQSYTEKDALSVSFPGDIYLLQIHADVTGVTPDTGSVEGGTLISVEGKYFGVNADGVGVKVGGVDCKVVDVTDTAIQCVTGAQPNNQTSFSGNRGLFREVWTDTSVNYDFSNAEWNTSASDYNIEITDQFGSPEEPSFGETDYYSARYRGYFVAPYDGEFRFMIYSDDQSELFLSMTQNPEDKVKIAFNSGHTSSYYTRPTEQISDPLNLVGGNRYYMEAFFSEGYGEDYLSVGLLMYDLPYSHSQLGIASDEKQIIQISSTVQTEIQRLSFDAGNSSVDNFILTLDGVDSTALSSSSSAEEVRNALFDMVGVECQRNGPVGDYFIDYEEEPFGYITGERVTDIEPFCGHVVLKNPDYVYYDGKTESSDGVYLENIIAQTQICFAYKGAISNKVTLKIDWEDTDGTERSNNRNYYIDGLSSSSSWRYKCFSTYEYINEDSWLGPHMKPSSIWYIRRVKLYKEENSAEDFYIDNFYIGDQVVEYTSSRQPARPNDILITDVMVEKSASEFDITFVAANCGNDYPLLGIKNATVEQGSTTGESVTFSDSSWPVNATVTIERIETASPPVTGNFRISWEDKFADIDATTTETKMKEILEKAFGVGKLNVERTGSCLGYSWAIEWLELGGNLPAIEFNMTNFNGNEVEPSIITEVDGAVTLSPIPGDYMRTPHTMPQVEVIINGIISSCSSENCGYNYDDAQTATITGIDTHEGSQNDNTTITITGSGFSAVEADNVVTIGETDCAVTSATATQIVCDVGNGEAGEYEVKVNVAPGGYASSSGVDVSFNYTFGIHSIIPSTGSPFGGTKVTITGYGFSKNPEVMEVYIGSKECIVTESTFNEIKCTIAADEQASRHTTNVVGAYVGMKGQVEGSENAFIEDPSLAAAITSLNQTRSLVRGGDVLAITGTNFGSDTSDVSINNNECTVISSADTLIECTIPANEPGTYTVVVNVPHVGYADGDDNTITYDFEVTGVFPDHGSLQGGTNVLITGSGFGSNTSLVDVTFGPIPCEVTAVKDDVIKCTSGSRGTVYEVTNQGKHEDYGVGYKWTSPNLDIVVGDVVNWQWSTPALVEAVGFTIQQTADEFSVDYDGQGFYAGERSKSGSYSYTFTTEGTYYYSSGPVNDEVSDEDKFYIVGIVNVSPYLSKSEEIVVSMNGIPARHNKSVSPSAPPDSNSCPGDNDRISSCDDDLPTCNSQDFCYAFWLCSTAEIEKVEPQSGPADSTITVTGSGFSNLACENEVYVGSHVCNVTTSSNTYLECIIETEDSLEVGYIHEISVNVKNRGLALNSIETPRNRSFILIPSVSSVSPVDGSLAGGTLLTIVGDGFSVANAKELTVTIGEGRICVVVSFTYTEIVCTTPAQSVDEAEFPIKVTINNQDSVEDVSFFYFQNSTPVVNGLAPESVSGPSTIIIISGDRFGTNADVIDVTIGGIACNVGFVNDTAISCDLGYVAYGTLSVDVYREGYGLAEFTVENTIWGDPKTYSISPDFGSKKGGTEITIDGSGFHADATSVVIDNKDCPITFVNVSTITCISDNHVAGEVDVIVTSNDREFPSVSYEYSRDYTPNVDFVTPSSGESGDTITIVGSYFGSETSDVQVLIDGEECTVDSVSSTEIECVVPSHAAGVCDIEVTIYNLGFADASDKTFEYNLTFNGNTPVNGSFAGQKYLNITGSGFNGESTTVTVCGNPCEVTSGTFTSLQCLLPANENTDDVSTLSCDIVVTVNDDVSTTSSDAFTYKKSLTATINSVSPARGGTGGGTNLTITGSSFNSSGNVVTIDGSECIISSESSNEINCTTEDHEGAIKTRVRVVTDDEDNIATQDNAEFYYVDVWSSKWTWGGREPPVDGDFVIVEAGQTLLLDVDSPVLSFLLIEGGSFIFDDETDIELHAENILIMDGGLLQVGTEEEPFQHKATIMMHGHQRSTEIPLYGAKTLAVRNGTLDLHGKPIPVTWTYLAQTAEIGDITLILEKEVTWNVGDQIAIASTGDRHSQRENEMVNITEISGDGRTLTIDPPLEYAHISMEQTIDGVFLSTKAEVGVLTRNVVVRGSVQEEWTEDIEACDAEFDTNQFATQTCFQGRFGEEIGSDQFGSQIMLFAKYQNQQLVTGRIEYVEVTHAGQAFRLGRYPIHFHLNGDVTGSYVRGCGIHHTFNRAVTIHAVDNLLVEHNVAFDIMGHAYFMEDGIEMGNIIQYNLGIFVKSSSSLLNVDITPAAFWITNPNNTVRHNAAAGGSHFGYWYNLPNHPGGPSATDSMCPRKMVMGEFYNNTAHSQGWYGLWIFPEYHPMEGGGCNSDSSTQAKFYNLTAWQVERGAEAIAVGGVQFHNFLISDADKAGIEFQAVDSGITFDNDGALIKDAVVIAYSALTETNRSTTCTKAGVQCPKSKGLTIDGVKFINFDQACCAAFRSCAHCKPDQGGFQARTKNLEFTNSSNKAFFKWEHEYWYEDLDGTFSGTANHIVLPDNPNLPPDHCSQDDAYSLGVPGASCDDTIKLHRMAFNEVAPTSLQYKNTLFTNEHGTSVIPYHLKRITHPEGWMITLIENDTYNFFFEYADHVTNITYNARFDGFNDGDFVIINHNLTQSPDHFETTDVSRNNSIEMVTYENNDYGDWHFDNETKDLYYLVSGKGINDVEGQNLPIHLRVYRCYYKDCIEPVLEPPPEGRPEDAVLWSEDSTWDGVEDGWGGNLGDGTFGQPSDGDDVMIQEGLWVVADKKLPIMRKLYIYGALELEDRANTINATYIFVTGTLIIGWPNDPFENQLQIFLNGNHFTEDIPLPDGPNMGSKVLGVFGRLEMHGIAPNVTWTKLAFTADTGSDQIKLVEGVDWGSGEEILITSTSYEAWETETFTIAEVIDAQTLRLNDTLKYKHIAETHTLDDNSLTYTEAAEVGLLSRNIQIIGADYNNLFEESFGSRVLIGKFVDDGLEFKGYAQISNVEFYHSGQEGWTDFYDPRYSVAYLDTGDVTVANPSYVRGCTFHNGFSPAIGIFGANGIVIEDNVIHHTVGAGIIAWGTDHEIIGNLVSLTVFPGTYQERVLMEDKTWPAGIEVQMSFDLILANNTVAGSERLLYRVSGEKCSEAKVWENNEGHSSLGGLMMLPPDGQRQCSRVSNFYLWKNFYYGIYLETTCSLVVSDVVLADNKVGILPYIYRPTSLSHDVSDKSFTMEDSFIIGTSTFFDCEEWQSEPENAFQCSGLHAPPLPPGGGKIGLMMTNFMSGTNNAPTKAFHGIKNYPAISGITQLKGVTFAHFQESCSARDYSIAPNPGNGDGIHPTTANGTQFLSVDHASKVFFFRPNVDEANPADCVDMTCDAMRKVFIKDLDGGILGIPGTVIPDSAFEWDGDPRYGLGDYRIPKMMVTNIDGSKIPYDDKCPDKGIIGNNDCTKNSDWQAFECHDLDYMMMIIESMDPDTEVRRLSPIAMFSEGYVDLINGPQDHGWCHGYTCQERISTFMAVVATGKEYEMYMSSTNPQHLRLHLLNATTDQKVVVGIWYANPQRLDVYHQGRYVMPNNGQIDGGIFTWVGEDPDLPDDQFKPTPYSNVYGENYFDRDWQTLWVLVRGNQPLDIITTPVIMVAIGVPAVAVDDFFEENLVSNLANLLGIDESQIRVVDVIREGSSRRRRRSEGAEAIVEIGDSPATEIALDGNSTTDANVTEALYGNYTEGNSTLGYDELVELQAQIVDAAQTGELSESLEVEVESLSMTDPVEPATDPTGGVRATNETGGSEEEDTLYGDTQEEEDIPVEVEYQFPSILIISQAPSGVNENWPFVVVVSVLDAQDEIVQNLGHSSSPWRMEVSLMAGTGPEGAQLLGNTTVDIIGGLANFTDVKLDIAGSGYILDFAVVYPNSSTLVPISTEAFSVAERTFAAEVNLQPTDDVVVGQTFDVGFDLIDVLTGLQVSTLESSGYNWSATIELYQPSNYFGSLNGNKTVDVDLMLATALFTDLFIDDIGYQYILEITITTTPSSSYQISQLLDEFDVVSATMVTHTGEPMQVTLRFLADYDTVAAGKEDNLKINFLNKFASLYTNVTISDVQVSRGSILVTFTMVGDVDNTAATIYNDLQAGRITLNLDGSIIEADQDYMMVDGEIYGPSDADEPSGVPLWAIILVVAILVLVVIIIAFTVYKLCYNPNKKLAAIEMMPLTKKEEAPRTSSYNELGGRSTPVIKVETPDNQSLELDENRPLTDTTSCASSNRSKSPGFNRPCRTPEVVSTSLPPGFADGSEEHVKEDRANMYIMQLTATRSFTKLGQMAVNLVGTLSDLRKELKVMLAGSSKDEPFILLTEALKDIDGASEKRQVVHETYASDSVLIRFLEDTDIAKLCVCGLVGQFECSLCHKQTYCSPQCQSSDWAKHIQSCNSGN